RANSARPVRSTPRRKFDKALCDAKSQSKKERADLTAPHLLNQGFHVTDIAFERAPSGGSQLVFGLGHSTFERFHAGDVSRVFEFPRMNAEIAVCRMHQVFQIAEGERFIRCKCAQNAEPQTLMNHPVQ